MRTVIYYLCLAAGLAAALAVSPYCGRARSMSKRNSLMFTLTGFLSGVLGAMLISLLYNLFLDAVFGAGMHETSRFSLFGALIFMPVLIALPARRMGIKYGDVTDMGTAGVFAVMTLGKIGCFINGCCYGVACAHCPANPVTGERVFPVQLLEAALTLALTVAAIILITRAPALRGVLYPVFLGIYCAGRFGCEFLRHEYGAEKAFLGGLDFWQLVCIVTFAGCAAWTAAAVIRRKRAGDDAI